VSEELENSLQQAVETYLNDRLQSINEQVSRLQTEVNETLSRLRESSNAGSLDGTALSAAIFAHLQTARGQKLAGATVSETAPQDTAVLRRSVQEIQEQQAQTEILTSLLKGAVHFAERVALFVIKHDQAIGWRVCEAIDPTNLELIGGVSLPLSSDTVLTRAVRERKSGLGDPDSGSKDKMLIDQLGGSPQVLSSVPLIVRGKVVAVLYADSAAPDSGRINLDALEVLVQVAAMAVNLVSIHRAPAESRPETTAVKAEPAPQPAAEVESTYMPQVEAEVAEPTVTAEATEVSAPAEVEETFAPPAIEAVAEQPAEAVDPDAAPAATEPVAEAVQEFEAATPKPQAATPAAEESVSPQPSVSPTPAAPAFASGYATPLGRARRFGVNEPDLPVEVSEEERRLHNDARRFARLLVSEIKLYNEPKVKEGRSKGDLYDRLREDIDRSRQMYDKRVAPPVAARHDYFHQELVNMLAEGDPAKLGGSYPGAVSAN